MPLTAVQIAQLARNAGWTTAHDISLATAICFAESSGTVDNIGGPNSDGSYDYGLWQINSVHKAYDKDKLLNDPQYNANAAHEIFMGQGWKAWSAFNNGSYSKFLDQGQSASTQITGVTAVTVSDSEKANPSDDPNTEYTGITKVLWYLTNGDDFWKRVGIGLGGVSLLIIAVWFVNGSVPGSSIVPATRVLKARHGLKQSEKFAKQRDANRLTVDRSKPKAS